MSFIQIENLKFSYPDSLEPVFSGLSVRLDSDWKCGLVGRNGTGKTTFLNLLCGRLKGEGRISANLAFRRFPYEIRDRSLSAFEIAEEIVPDVQFWRICREINLLGLEEELLFRPFQTLSGGERTKFLLATMFVSEGFPLLDEPTDHLDGEGRKTLARYLSGKCGFLVVSHDRTFLDGCCDHILSLHKTGAEVVQGNYSVWREERDKQESADRADKLKLEKERKRLHAASVRTREWADKAEHGKSNEGGRLHMKYSMIDRGYIGAKAAKLQKRAGIIADRAQRAENNIKELLKSFDTDETLRLFPEPYFKRELLRLSDITVSFPQKEIFSRLNFSVQAGERVAIIGKNGAGKSTLFQLIAGELTDYNGERQISPRLKISYVPQIFKYEGTLSEYAERYAVEESYFKAILAKFGFESKDFLRNMAEFSEGQKKKAALARSLCERAHLYLWDEPLNYLDVIARGQIEDAVLNSGATFVFVEHDSAFTERIATKLFFL